MQKVSWDDLLFGPLQHPYSGAWCEWPVDRQVPRLPSGILINWDLFSK